MPATKLKATKSSPKTNSTSKATLKTDTLAPDVNVFPKAVVNDKGKVWCPLAGEGSGEWRSATPEEVVRQGFVLYLKEQLGYADDQMRQERKTISGKRSPRVDIAVWDAPASRTSTPARSPSLVVECKAENVNIHPRDYYQGESYARSVGAEILVMHNLRQTAIFRVLPGLPGELVPINAVPLASDWGDARRMEAIKNATRAFSRDEFRNLLFRCHSILRDVHKMEPGKAFDVISKILFVKMYIERTGTWGTFTTDFLHAREKTRLPTDQAVHIQLFEQTKLFYGDDDLFSAEDRLDEISEATFSRIVKELEQFNLSATGEDIKGIAFEKFLGDTFRGELGQFFTPRTVVDFMVQALDPREGELICDPCSGSGGFLIRTFEHIRTHIERDVQARKDLKRIEIEALSLPEEKEIQRINEAFSLLNRELEPDESDPPSRIYALAHHNIFGADAEVRAARTSKMNMIMHGDGHGGIHFHDGLLDVNGIFASRFDVVLTNPPFGSNVGDDQRVGSTEQTRVLDTKQYVERCKTRYAEPWHVSHKRMVEAAKTKLPILELFEIGRSKPNRATEVLFLERCIDLLKPGGRVGIVLPDGNLNNPSLWWLRRWVEGKARLIGVVSLPEETFKSAEATVKASIVFLQKFMPSEVAKWTSAWDAAHSSIDPEYAKRRDELREKYELRIATADDKEISNSLDKLAGQGITRRLVGWQLKAPPPYPRGVVQSEMGRIRWLEHDVKHSSTTKTLKRHVENSWTSSHEEISRVLYAECRASLRRLDVEHSNALWEYVRETFDYPVFTAAPAAVGITATGGDGPNELPSVLRAWEAFLKWANDGGKPEDMPSFVL